VFSLACSSVPILRPVARLGNSVQKATREPLGTKRCAHVYRVSFTLLYSSPYINICILLANRHHKESTLHFQPTMKSFAIGTLFLAIRSATAQVCGQSGYDNSGHDSASLPAYAVDTQATTPQLCSALCKSDSNCQSFAIGKETCLLYAVPTENNITPDDKRKDFSSTRSPYYFYDVNCEITSSSPPLSHSSPICGVKGYDRGNPGSGWIESGSTPEQAAAGCRATPNCTAFALINNFVSHRGTGSFRYSSLVDNFDANSIDDPDIGSSFYFYELSCPGV
jgi:hypothetical protein